MASMSDRVEIGQLMAREIAERAALRWSDLEDPDGAEFALELGCEEHRAIARAGLALLNDAVGTAGRRVQRRGVDAVEHWLATGKLGKVRRVRGPLETEAKRTRRWVERWIGHCDHMHTGEAGDARAYAKASATLAGFQAPIASVA